MFRPRLIYYNDAHHFHAKRIEPPATIHMLQWPVDEIAGTGVDLLVFGLGYGDVYFHQSKVGRVVGQEKDVWENYIDWRIMRMVEESWKLGTDQLREVILRGREIGMKVFPSLKLNDPAQPGQERCGWLKWRRGAEVCIREAGSTPGTEWCYDFSLAEVRQDKLGMVREVLEDYEADGIELDFMFRPQYFRQSEIEQNIPVMSEFVSNVRSLATEIGLRQNRQINVIARVDDNRERNMASGLDVVAWLEAGSLDGVVGQEPQSFFNTQPTPSWISDAANNAVVLLISRPPRRVYDERTSFPSIEMYRALSQTLRNQGFSGLYLGYLPWPLSGEEYEVLREVAYPEIFYRRNKRYFIQPGDSDESQLPLPTDQQIPVVLKDGETVVAKVFVADDLEEAYSDREMRPPILTLRFAFYCIEDDVEIRFNGRMLSLEDCEISDERALTMPVSLRNPISAPTGFSAHWFRFNLEPKEVVQGENIVEIKMKTMSKTAGFTRSLNGVEILMRYKDFVRPEGLGTVRIGLRGGG